MLARERLALSVHQSALYNHIDLHEIRLYYIGTVIARPMRYLSHGAGWRDSAVGRAPESDGYTWNTTIRQSATNLRFFMYLQRTIMGKIAGGQGQNPKDKPQKLKDKEQKQKRDSAWPGSENWIWNPTLESTKGYARIPRLMPLIVVLIKQLADTESHAQGDPSSVYLELWFQDRGNGYVSIDIEADHAYASGYSSNRSLRTWRAHMKTLEAMGFIKLRSQGNRDFAHVLLLDPLAVVHWYHLQGKVPEAWWMAFTDLARAVHAKIPAPLDPSHPPPPAPKKVIPQHAADDDDDG
jgi:hypothetical protein